MDFYANLHMHSTHSDGVYSPEELVRIAKSEGYKAIAITDHDIGTAYPELVKACLNENMECIFGVEFSVKDPYDFHIVGFDFNPEYPPMKEYLDMHAEASRYNARKCFEEAVSLGNIKGITWDEVLEYNEGISKICNNHIFRAMKSKGLVEESQYMEWFDTNFRYQRAKYKSKEAFLPLHKMVTLIKEAGGFAVCAHPKTEQLNRFDLLMECGVEGLEASHPGMSCEERERAYKLCMDNNLFISGGSDHCGLCGGLYASYPDEESLRKSYHYIEPMSVGVTKEHFKEIQTRKLKRK